MNAHSSTKKTLKEWLGRAQNSLKLAGISTARLDSMVLLEDVTGKNRSYIIAHPEEILDDKIIQKLDKQIKRRARHEPLAYIRGKSWFYGREFRVSADTLEPRPETEIMIEHALQIIDNRINAKDKIRVADIGTGSGAIGITIKLESPEVEVTLIDISSSCLMVAQKNAQALYADVTLYQGNLLDPIYNLSPTTYNLVLANLPYVPDSYVLNKAAMYEPKLAIFGGPDGLDVYRKLFEQLSIHKPRFVVTESLPFQHALLAKIATKSGYKLTLTNDFIQVFISLDHK